MGWVGVKKEIIEILSTEAFNRILTGQAIQIAQLNAVIALLIKTNIPFDLSFTPGDQRIAKEARLVIHISPASTINFLIQFEAGRIVL